IELLQEVRRGMTAVVATKKQLEAQAGRLDAQASRLRSQARIALERGREDLARHALERRSALLVQVGDVRAQVTTLEAKQAHLDRELAALSSGAQVETELAALKGEVLPPGPLPPA